MPLWGKTHNTPRRLTLNSTTRVEPSLEPWDQPLSPFYKQETDPRHTLDDPVQTRKRLKSRNSFMIAESMDPIETPYCTFDKCRPQMSDHLPRKDWVSSNRARTKVGHTAHNLKRWNISHDSSCTCGASEQTMEHLLRDCTVYNMQWNWPLGFQWLQPVIGLSSTEKSFDYDFERIFFQPYKDN